ncbi:hypothetical protein TNCV_4751931 [Trichonephila clavipes]|nr:hypothetical protein TNCV_4751931 [Trichonephila clavipes]
MKSMYHFECRIVVFEFCHPCGRELQIISRLARSPVQGSKTLSKRPWLYGWIFLVSSTPRCDKSIQTPNLPFQPTLFSCTLSRVQNGSTPLSFIAHPKPVSASLSSQSKATSCFSLV